HAQTEKRGTETSQFRRLNRKPRLLDAAIGLAAEQLNKQGPRRGRRERRLRRVSQFVGAVPAGTPPSRWIGRGVPSKGTALAKPGGCLPTGREMGIVPLGNATIRIMAAQECSMSPDTLLNDHPHPDPADPAGRTAPTGTLAPPARSASF